MKINEITKKALKMSTEDAIYFVDDIIYKADENETNEYFNQLYALVDLLEDIKKDENKKRVLKIINKKSLSKDEFNEIIEIVDGYEICKRSVFYPNHTWAIVTFQGKCYDTYIEGDLVGNK